MMKKYKIILIVTAGITVTLLVVSLIMLRKNMQTILSEAEKELRYSVIAVSSFDRLDLPANWNIKIKQDRECKVELAAEGNVSLKPAIKSINGTLMFQVDTLQTALKGVQVYARITMPILKEIKAGQGTAVRLENFQLDSLHVSLQHGVVFTGKNFGFKNLSFKTYGEVSIQLNNTIAN